MDRDRELRERLVQQMERAGVLASPNVAAAFLAVPRHRFVPEQPLERAYEDRALALKESGGSVISSISQPGMIAQMLEMLAVRSGDRIFEIGTGSGYNAALLSVLAGAAGSVVTMELEDDLAESARFRLRELGYANVDVRTGDAETQLPRETFDRIIVTARANDIPLAWWNALNDGGRLVVPLDIAYGGERVVAFVRDGDRLTSLQTHACSFIGMRNGGESAPGDVFFRNASLRYAKPPDARAPVEIVARRRDDVRPEFLETADVVVARPQTFFAFTLGS